MTREIIGNIHDKNEQKQALIDMMRGDEEIGLLTIMQKITDMSDNGYGYAHVILTT